MTHTKSMRTINKLVASLMVAAMFAAAFLVGSHNASAAEGTVTLNAGDLGITAPADFTYTNVLLDGLSDKESTGVFTVGVNDASATNAGWHLTASLTLLTDGTHTLPAATIEAVSDIAVDDTTGATAATNNITYPYTFPAVNATTFYNAAVNTGQGSHSYDVTITQSIPKNSFAGNYTAVLSVDFAAGPA